MLDLWAASKYFPRAPILSGFVPQFFGMSAPICSIPFPNYFNRFAPLVKQYVQVFRHMRPNISAPLPHLLHMLDPIYKPSTAQSLFDAWPKFLCCCQNLVFNFSEKSALIAAPSCKFNNESLSLKTAEARPSRSESASKQATVYAMVSETKMRRIHETHTRLGQNGCGVRASNTRTL